MKRKRQLIYEHRLSPFKSFCLRLRSCFTRCIRYIALSLCTAAERWPETSVHVPPQFLLFLWAKQCHMDVHEKASSKNRQCDVEQQMCSFEPSNLIFLKMTDQVLIWQWASFKFYAGQQTCSLKAKILSRNAAYEMLKLLNISQKLFINPLFGFPSLLQWRLFLHSTAHIGGCARS